MRTTPFGGLTVLAPGEPFSTDDYSFQDRNPDVTAKLLQVGAVTHRHDEHPALLDPGIAPSGSAVASGGTFPADVTAIFGYTLVDEWGGETLLSPIADVPTPPKLAPPDAPPGAADYSAGGLLAGTYMYVKTWVDGAGGETTPSIYSLVTIDPGHASARIELTDLASGMAAASAAGWRVYKSANGSDFLFLASGTADSLIDDGTLCADCTGRPPTVNTTQDRNSVILEMPLDLASGAVGFRLYGAVGAGFGNPSFFGQYPAASAGATFTFTSFNPGDGRPPPVSTALPGATKINPETDMLQWLPGRASGVASASAVAASGSVEMAIELAASYEVFRVATNYPARVRLYAGAAYQSPDTARASGTPPSGDHGVVLDQVNDTELDTAVAPGSSGMNLDAVDPTIPLTIDNLDAVPRDIVVTLLYLRRE